MNVCFKTLFCLVSLLWLGVGCSGQGKSSSSELSASTECSPTAGPPGYICLNGQWQVLVDGYCVSDSDCNLGHSVCCGAQPTDVSSGFCSTVNVCTNRVRATSITTPIWFASDPIRPGATSTSGANDYNYNIMAKGYKSLDDWCMTQAQQSGIAAMKRVGYWQALLPALPDTSSGSPGSRAFVLKNTYANIAGGTQSVRDPNRLPYSSNNNTISDKNGTPNSVGGSWAAWSGFTRGYCPATVDQVHCDLDTQDCDNSCLAPMGTCLGIVLGVQLSLVGLSVAAITKLALQTVAMVAGRTVDLGGPIGVAIVLTALTAGVLGCVGGYVSKCWCENQPSQCSYYAEFKQTHSPYCTLDGYSPISSLNSLSDYFGSWNSDQVSDYFGSWNSDQGGSAYGVLVSPPNTCNSAFDMAYDCESHTAGDAVGTYYNANGSAQHPIMCIQSTAPVY